MTDTPFDFDASAEGQLGDADGAAGVGAGIAEEFAEEFGGTVGDQVLFDESGSAVDENEELDESTDSVEIAEMSLKRSEKVDGDGASGRRSPVTAM